MTIVLDSNVLIAAFISPKGICNEVLELCIHNHSLIISEFILSEVRENLNKKFNFSDEEINEIIDLILLKFSVVKIKGNIINVCRDPDDNNIIETAISGKSSIIISGDKDLLDLKEYQKIKIISPREFYNFEKGIS